MSLAEECADRKIKSRHKGRILVSAPSLYKAFGSDRACGKLYDKICVVGLNLCLVRRLASYDLAALFTAVDDDVAALRIGQCSYGAQSAKALVCSVAGIDVDVYGVEAKRAVIA